MKRGKWGRRRGEKYMINVQILVLFTNFTACYYGKELYFIFRINPVIFFGHKNVHRSDLCYFHTEVLQVIL